MPFFDLHTHPSFKSALLNDDVSKCPNPVDFVDVQLNVPFSACVEKIAGNSLDSQCSFGQWPGGSLVVASFIAFERVYAFVDDLKKIKNLGPSILPDMRDQKESYFDRMTKREVKHFLNFEEKTSGPRKYKLINRISEYPNPPDPNTVYVVASIEGIHNFYIRQKIEDQEAKPAEIVQALRTWKQQSAADPDRFPRLFYITLAHHGQNVLTNHAWAIPVRFATDKVSVGSFDPTGNGLTTEGESFIRNALEKDVNGNRILLDVKHLSLRARQQVYDIVEREFPGVPILATHMGVTGTSWDTPPINRISPMAGRPKNLSVSYGEIGGFLRRVPPTSPDPLSALTRIPFNTWSINLYDEDIINIMRSGGLIGVSMDRRILGATLEQSSVEEERFSRADIPTNWRNNMGVPVSFYPTTPLPTAFGGIRSKTVTDLWAFCQQIIHIVLITELAKGNPDGPLKVPVSVDPWRHICLGSDFDGLITALKTSPSADQLGQLFRTDMKLTLQEMAKHLNTNPAIVNPLQVPDDVLNRLSVQNGVDFLKKHFV